MQDKEYGKMMYASLLSFIKNELLEDKDKTENCYYLQQRVDELNLRFEIPNGMYHIEERPLYEIINERIDSTNNPDLSPQELYALKIDLDMAVNFAGRNLGNGDYKAAIKCSQRILQDYELLKSNSNINQKLENSTQIANDIIRHSHTRLENPDNAHLIFELEEHIANENYEAAHEIQKLMGIK